jgi:hypothetical protein
MQTRPQACIACGKIFHSQQPNNLVLNASRMDNLKQGGIAAGTPPPPPGYPRFQLLFLGPLFETNAGQIYRDNLHGQTPHMHTVHEVYETRPSSILSCWDRSPRLRVVAGEGHMNASRPLPFFIIP